MKKLPTTIYGYLKNESGKKGEEYLMADENPEVMVEQGETLLVGVYKLQGFAEIKNSTDVKPSK